MKETDRKKEGKKRERSQSGVHKRQKERVHFNVHEAEISHVQFTYTRNRNEFMNDLSMNSGTKLGVEI